MTRRTGIAELKDHLSEYLRDVESGSEVVITDRARPIARLVPIAPSEEHPIVPAQRKLNPRDRKRGKPLPLPVSSTAVLLEERQRHR